MRILPVRWDGTNRIGKQPQCGGCQLRAGLGERMAGVCGCAQVDIVAGCLSVTGSPRQTRNESNAHTSYGRRKR